jgi:hypothetical protein
MLDARVAGSFQTRHPKKRPKTISIQIKRGETFETVGLSLAEASGFMFLPKFASPSLISTGHATTGVTLVGTQTLVFGKSPQDVASNLGTKTLQSTANIDVGSFVRMLAKIGYSFAVGHVGAYPLAEVPVLPLIRHSENDAGTWVGSATFRLSVEEKQPMHALGLRTLTNGSEEILMAQVKLFANTGATGYEVVVRRRSLKT